MSYKGHVRNGVVVLPPEAKIEEGAEVEVRELEKPSSGEQGCAEDFTEMLVGISQRVSGLPRDLAEQHDHYLYGTPKR